MSVELERVLFLDRDGTLIREPEDYQIDALEKLDFLPGVMHALRRLSDAGFKLVIVSNQDGLGQPHYPVEGFWHTHERMLRFFAGEGVHFAASYVDEHYPEDNHPNRKPNPGMPNQYMAQHPVDRSRSYMVGDRKTDAQLAKNIGVESLTIKDPNSKDGDLKCPEAPQEPTTFFTTWKDLADFVLNRDRIAHVHRKTSETEIELALNVDGTGVHFIQTGLGFFDHMLAQFAVHGGWDLTLSCVGDLQVDEHHTVEDVAIALGQAIKQAAGNKRGINRYAFMLPMDESRALCTVDFSGRPYLVFKGKFTRERVGELPTEMVFHFFRTLAEHAAITLHIEILGENDHHQIEAAFKALARCFRQALHRTGTAEMPSSKGVL